MASYSLSPSLVFKGFYDDNTPLVGGKVYTWLAGTDTPVDTYQSNGGAANLNPVILNARGEANIWLDPAISYKIEVQDSDGNIVIPAKDNITVGDAGGLNAASIDTVSDLRAYAGTATLIYLKGYNEAGDGCGGWVYFESTSSAPDDGVIHFSPNSAPPQGRFIRDYSGGPISIRYAGDSGIPTGQSDAAFVRLVGYLDTYSGSGYYPIGQYYFDDEQESASGAAFIIDDGAKFYIKNGLKINGPIIHPPTRLVYTDTGYTDNLDISESASVAAFEWWGAVGDGSTNDLTAIQKAFDSGCFKFYSPSTSGYLTSAPVNLPFAYSVETNGGVFQSGNVYQIYPGLRESATVQGSSVYSQAISSAKVISLSGIYGTPVAAKVTCDGANPFLFTGQSLDMSDLGSVGDSFSFHAWGELDHSHTVDIYVYVGGSSALGFSSVTTLGYWSIRGRILRLASGYSIMADFISDSVVSTNNVSQAISSPAVLQIAVGSASSGDMSQNGFLVKLEPQKL